VTFQSGETRRFDINIGNLLSITDRNGNTTQIAYDGYGRLSKVTDPLSRYLIFFYGNGNSPYLVTKVTSSASHVVQYTYNQNQLISVTETDGTVLNFEYNDTNPALITAVKDVNGKVLESHTYDNLGRGLTSVRANGVDAITVSYQTQ
jgi:YD repeat-containing protein